MYSSKPGLIIGFHGCDKTVRENIITGQATLNPSKNEYDWLGNGIYFWENNEERALNFAKELQKNPRPNKTIINVPSTLGAVINLGYCLDLLDSKYLSLVKESYNSLKESYKTLNLQLPVNSKGKGSNEFLLRNLDCKVIENLHAKIGESAQAGFDSVRGVFIEGRRLYKGAGFNEKNHIQICVRNPNCIKGFFIPRNFVKGYKQV